MKCLSNLKKKAKEFNVIDLGLTKLTIIALVLLIMNLSPDLIAWVETQHWALFLIIALIFALKPLKKILFLFKR